MTHEIFDIVTIKNNKPGFKKKLAGKEARLLGFTEDNKPIVEVEVSFLKHVIELEPEDIE